MQVITITHVIEANKSIVNTQTIKYSQDIETASLMEGTQSQNLCMSYCLMSSQRLLMSLGLLMSYFYTGHRVSTEQITAQFKASCRYYRPHRPERLCWPY